MLYYKNVEMRHYNTYCQLAQLKIKIFNAIITRHSNRHSSSKRRDCCLCNLSRSVGSWTVVSSGDHIWLQQRSFQVHVMVAQSFITSSQNLAKDKHINSLRMKPNFKICTIGLYNRKQLQRAKIYLECLIRKSSMQKVFTFLF